MKHLQTIFFLAIFSVAAFTACKGDGNQTAANALETDTTKTLATATGSPESGSQSGNADGADASPAQEAEAIAAFIKKYSEDLKGLVQGKWQSAADLSVGFEFAGNKIRYTKDGKLTQEVEFVIDPKCTSADCKFGDSPLGWCFIEKTPGGNKCNLVLSCDQAQMTMRLAGGTKEVRFNRIKE